MRENATCNMQYEGLLLSQPHHHGQIQGTGYVPHSPVDLTSDQVGDRNLKKSSPLPRQQMEYLRVVLDANSLRATLSGHRWTALWQVVSKP